jgi:hypothetical protein
MTGMNRVRVELLNHSLMRTVPCCLCGSEWEELLVGVALVVGPAVAGDLCPRCLSREPADAAARLRALMRELADSNPGHQNRPTATDAEQLGNRVARLRQDFARLRSLSRLVCAPSAELRSASRPARQTGADLWAAVLPTSGTGVGPDARPGTGPELRGDTAP